MRANPIEYVAGKIAEEEALYKFQLIKELLIKMYHNVDKTNLWMDYPEYFKEYQTSKL